MFFVPLTDLSVLLSVFPGFRFPGLQWALTALAAPVAAWAAGPFHPAALRNARHRAASMDTLVSRASWPPAAGRSTPCSSWTAARAC